MDFYRTRTATRDAAVASSSSRKLFDQSTYVKLFSPINSISFASSTFAVTSSTRTQIFNARSDKATKTISRFNDVVRSANYRADGKLIVTGDDSALVQIFDAQSRTVLRQFKGHTLPVHCARFSRINATEIVSASDDRSVVLWDMPQERQVRQLHGHDDYVRSVQTSPDNGSLILSGSYDGTLRLWDVRMAENEGCAIQMKHGAPIEDVTFFPSSSSAALSVGGPILRSWDLLMAGQCRTAVSNHSKTITSLVVHDDQVLTAGLDQLVKVYDMGQNFKVSHTMRYSAPILSCALNAEGSQFIVGMTDGTLCVQRKTIQKKQAQDVATDAEAEEKPPTDGAENAKAAINAPSRRPNKKPTVKLTTYDRLLKSFRYRDALDHVLRKGVHANATFGLLDELRNRNTINEHGIVVHDGLRRAIEGRDDVTLEPLLRFLLRHAGNAQWTSIVHDTLNVVMDVYAPVLGQSPVIDELFGKVWTKVSSELDVQQDLLQVRGALEMILLRSTFAQSSAVPIAGM